MLRHLRVDGVEFLAILLVVVYYSRLCIVRNQNTGYAAKVFIHMHMGGDPGLLFLVDKGLNVRILTVPHNAYEEFSTVSEVYLTSIKKKGNMV